MIVTISAVMMLFWRLGRGALFSWDEATYAQMSKEFIHSGDWLTLHFNYQPWFDKPPLFMWLTAAFYQLFGINELWSRAASAVCGVAVVVITYLLAKMICGRAAAIASCLALLTSFQFIRQARFGTMDVMLTLFLYIALYAYWRMDDRSFGWWYVACASCGLAIMTKGAAALVAPAVLGILLLIDGQLFSLLRQERFWLGLLLGFLVAAPWHFYMYFLYGKQFINIYLLANVVEKVTSVVDKHAHGKWFYVEVLNQGFYPWFYLSPFAIALSIRQVRQGMPRFLGLLLIVFIVFTGYTFVPTGLPWYMIPLYPALAILVGYLMVEALRSNNAIAFSALILGSVVIAVQARAKFLLVAGFLSVLLFAILYLSRKQSIRQSLVWALLLLFTLGGLGRLRPLYDLPDTSIAKLSRLSAPVNPTDREPLVLGPTVWLPTAVFYSNRPVMALETADAVRNLDRRGVAHLILEESDLPLISPHLNVQIVARDGSLLLISALPRKASF